MRRASGAFFCFWGAPHGTAGAFPNKKMPAKAGTQYLNS